MNVKTVASDGKAGGGWPVMSDEKSLPAPHSSPVIRHRLTAKDVPLEKLKGSKLLTEAEKVAELSRQFEAVFLRQILGQARKVLVQSKFESESATSGLYNDMVISQLADSISQSGDFGLASSLQAQLHRQLLNEPVPDGKPPAESGLEARAPAHKPAEFFLPSSTLK